MVSHVVALTEVVSIALDDRGGVHTGDVVALRMELDETVEAILAPDRFLAALNQPPQLQRRAANIFLAPKCRGRLAQLHGLEKIRRLPTLYSMSVGCKPGELLGRVAGLVTLIDEDIQAIERDIAVIRALEHEGIFEVEQRPPA